MSVYWSKITLLTGVDIMAGKWVPHLGFLISIVIIANWTICMIYPSYINWPDIMGVITPLTHFSLLFIGIIRFTAQMMRPSFVVNYKDKIQKFYVKYENNLDLRDSLNKRMKQIKIWINVTTILNIEFYTIHVYTFIFFLITGRRILAIPVLVPFTDPNTLTGYFCSLLSCQSIGVIGFLSNASHDVFFIALGMHASAVVDVMCYKLKNLSKSILLQDENLKLKLTEIIDDYEDFKKYLEGYFDYFQLNNIYSIFSVAFPVCLNILLALTSEERLGAGIGLFSAAHVFLFCFQPCLMGTIIASQVIIIY